MAIHKALFKFIHRECPDLEFLSKRTYIHSLDDGPTSDSVAKVVTLRSSTKTVHSEDAKLNNDVAQLISAMIAVAFLGPDPVKYVKRLQEPDKFEQTTMREIQQVIIEIESERSKATNKTDADETLEAAILALEAERAELLEKLKVARMQHADTISRLEHLQESYESLKVEADEHLQELYVLREATEDGASDSQVIKALRNRIKEQDELITSQEAQVKAQQDVTEKLKRDVTTLLPEADRAKQLDEEIKELRYKSQELERKANAAERLRGKLEEQQKVVIEVQNLRFEKDQLLKKTTDYDRLVQRNTSLEQALQEIRSSHAQAEETLFLLNNQKRMLEETNRTLANEITRLTELRSNDEQFIAELQEQAGSQIAADHSGGAISLEQELEGTQQMPGLMLELSRLKAENALLKRGVGSTETSQLRADLEEEQRKYQELRNKYTEIVERHSVAQDQITALVNDAAGEGSVKQLNETLATLSHHLLNEDFYRTRAFNELRTQLLQANMDHKREAQRANDLQTQVADKERDLLVARTELSAMSKDGTEALEELKATDELVSASLRDELDALRTRVKSLTSEIELQRTQLLEAFVAKDKVQKEIEALRDSKPAVENKNITDEVIAEEINKTSEKIEKLRDRLRQRQEVMRFQPFVLVEHPSPPSTPTKNPPLEFGWTHDEVTTHVHEKSRKPWFRFGT